MNLFFFVLVFAPSKTWTDCACRGSAPAWENQTRARGEMRGTYQMRSAQTSAQSSATESLYLKIQPLNS